MAQGCLSHSGPGEGRPRDGQGKERPLRWKTDQPACRQLQVLSLGHDGIRFKADRARGQVAAGVVTQR